MQQLIYGKHSALACLLNKKRKILSLWCTKPFAAANSMVLESFSPALVSSNKLDALTSGGRHQGIALKALHLPTIEPSKAYKAAKRIVVLDKVEDPHNVGAIMRSAAAFDFDSLVILRSQALSCSSTVAKVASGALEQINFLQVPNIARALVELKEEGFWVVGLDCGGATGLKEAALNSGKLALVLGGEGGGIRQLVKRECDFLVRIPTQGSLNVSNAAAIAFYLARV